MEIKRVIAGGLTTLAAGATLVLGVGAVTLGDFVQVTGNTMTSPYIVIGDNAAAADTLAGADIAVALAGQATETVSVSGAVATMAVSDGAAVQTKSDKLYFEQLLNLTAAKLTYKELPVLLNTETFKQDDGDTVEVAQRIYTHEQAVKFNKADTDWETPVLNVYLEKNKPLYTYQIRFSPALDTGELEDQTINLLGTEFVFGEASNQGGEKLTLFESSQTKTVAAGESITVTAGGEDFVITVIGISEGASASDNTATIDINGESSSYGAGDDIEEGELSAHVKAINAFKFPVESGSVELFVGSQSMVLEEGEEVTLGGDEVDGTLVDITNTTTKIRQVEVIYSIQDKDYLEVGDSFADPVFGAFEFAFGGIYPAVDAASKDYIQIDTSDEEVSFTFTNADDITYESVLLYATGAGVIETHDGDYVVNFMNNETLTEGEYVVVTDGAEYTYILQYTDISGSTGEEVITLEDVSSGSEYSVTADDLGETIGIGSIDVEVTGFIAGSTETVALNSTGSAAGDLADIWTKNGAKLSFAINNSAVTAGGFDGTFWEGLNLTESDFETEPDLTEDVIDILIPAGVTATVGGISVADSSFAVGDGMVADDDGDYEYGLSEAGTYFVLDDTDDDDEVIKIYTPDEPTPVYVAFGTSPSFAGGEGADAGTVEQAVQIKNSISKMESEVTADASLSRDLVLLGGPCANGLVAEILEMSASNPECATEFTALYPTEGVITVVEDAFSSGQKALVVAGVNRAATRDLAVKVMQGTLDYSA
jgi:hypothetical protein